MATIAASDQSSTPVIDFEEEEKKLHITDPFFAFYLRWGELIRGPVQASSQVCRTLHANRCSNLKATSPPKTSRVN
jgi:hypothetical protein